MKEDQTSESENFIAAASEPLRARKRQGPTLRTVRIVHVYAKSQFRKRLRAGASADGRR
jgi:hypothetical protein